MQKKCFIVSMMLCLCVFLGGCLEELIDTWQDEEPHNVSKPAYSFWVTLNMNPEIPVRYKVEQVFLVGENGEKIGTSMGEFNGRYKIVVPEKYKETGQRFVVEFSRETSFFNTLPGVAKYPMAVSILKAFHYTTPEKYEDGSSALITIPDKGETIVIPSEDHEIDLGDLAMGYSEDSKDILATLPDIPPMYKIELAQGQVARYTSQGYRAYIGILTKLEDGLPTTLLSGGYPTPSDYDGFCAGDDWYLVVNNDEFVEGTKVRLWVVYTHNGPLTRLYYQDIVLPEVFTNIKIEPNFAGLPIDKTLLKVLGQEAYSRPPHFTADESYVLVNAEGNELSTQYPAWNTSGIFNEFRGEFRGAGFTITGLNLNSTSLKSDYGLFATIEGHAPPNPGEDPQYAVVADLTIEITAATAGPSGTGRMNFAGVVGNAKNYTLIRRVKVVDLSGNFNRTMYAGLAGIAGLRTSGAIIDDCEVPAGLPDVPI